MVVGWGQDCIEDVEVELWGDCYNIEETTEINYSYVSLGEIPLRIGFLINLNYIHISDCGLSGQIPPELGNLVNLVSLQVYDNNLDLPDSLDVDINSNLIGEIPVEIGNLVNLQQLDLRNNDLTGNFPTELTNLNNLNSLLLNGNQLSGEIPSEIGVFQELVTIDLGNNQFIGEIPESLFDLTNLNFLSLVDNNLEGHINSNINNLSLVYFLDLSSNNFSGEIPTEINDLDLYFLNLNNNQFSGTISNEFCDIDFLDLSHNNFCPPYPECLTEEDIGYQDTTNCSLMSSTEIPFPIEYTLHQPFPNPFNPTTSISFSIPEQSQTSIKVYDVKGNLISTLLNQTMNIGHHQIEWNGENLSSATYFIRINSGEFSDVKKVVLVK